MATTTHRRQYVLDTSAIIDDSGVFKQFPNSDVIIPIAVLNELDKLKKGSNDVARNARVAIRTLDKISDLGDISVGILLDDDVMLKIDATYIDAREPPFNAFGDPSYGDTQILACLYSTWQQHPERDVILISNDINLRIKAKARGIASEAREKNNGKSISEMYSGVQIITNIEAALQLQQKGFIDPDDFGFDLSPHECLILQDEDGNDIAMGRRNTPDKISLIKKQFPWDLNGKNREQDLAINLLMDKNVDLVTLTGNAGTGKSIVAIACALELVFNKREYDKLIIYRPIVNFSGELGFLPGLLEEKLSPYFQAVLDAFEILFANKNGTDFKRDLEMYQKKGKIEFGAMSYIRGRSINRAIIFIDEVQNISPDEIKTLLSRCGFGSKIILAGDQSQIDTKNLDAINNGLTKTVDCFKSSWLSGHVMFINNERSRLAQAAAELL